MGFVQFWECFCINKVVWELILKDDNSLTGKTEFRMSNRSNFGSKYYEYESNLIYACSEFFCSRNKLSSSQ